MAEKWIQNAIKKPGALRKELGVKKGEKIPEKKLAKAALVLIIRHRPKRTGD